MRLVGKALTWYSTLLVLTMGWLFFQRRLQVSLFVRSDQPAFLIDLGIGTGFAITLIFLSWFSSRHCRWAQLLETEFRKILTPLSAGPIILLGVSSGVVEETFFRGALQGTVGLFAASSLFGAAHLIPRRELLAWPLYATLIGFILGCLVEIRQTLFPAILAHTVSNIILIWMLNRETITRDTSVS